MPSYPVPSGDGFADIPLGQARGKPVKSVHFYQGREIRRALTNEADRIPCDAPVLYSEAAHEQRNHRIVDDLVVDGVYGAF
jgi:hypothetical protein